MDAEWIFFATCHGKSPYDSVRGFVKRYVAKYSSQRPLPEQVFSYQSILNLCVREIPSITFFGVSQSQRLCPKQGVATILYQYLATELFTNSQERIEFLQFDFDKSLTEEIDIKNIKCFSYVSCIYDTFSWVGIVTQVNVHKGNL